MKTYISVQQNFLATVQNRGKKIRAKHIRKSVYFHLLAGMPKLLHTDLHDSSSNPSRS
jgi:hypothetical protein